jgi:hypothetical protein
MLCFILQTYKTAVLLRRHLTPALYIQILRVIAGKEAPAKGQEATNDFLTLLPYFVLAGLGGVRNCELIRYKRGEAVLQWADILCAV